MVTREEVFLAKIKNKRIFMDHKDFKHILPFLIEWGVVKVVFSEELDAAYGIVDEQCTITVLHDLRLTEVRGWTECDKGAIIEWCNIDPRLRQRIMKVMDNKAKV